MKRLGSLGLLFPFLCSCQGGSPTEEEPRVWECLAEDGSEPDSLPELGCESDFDLLASQPTDSSLPGALSVKTIIDRVDENRTYFQDSNKYRLHYDFASEFLSAKDGLPVIPSQDDFNENYYSAQRRFYLGAVTFYEGPAKWVYEMSPYDTADANMVEESFRQIADSSYFGSDLYYHPSGEAAEAVAEELPSTVKVITTEELYEGIDYQALNVGRSCGRLVFFTAEELEESYVSYQDIVVLGSVPNDISVAQGIITAEFQTPLSHVNVLSQNRGTPNMALKGAFDSEELRALEGEWVTLEVGAFGYTIEATAESESGECLVQPAPIEISDMDLSVTEITDVEDIFDPDSEVGMREQISARVPAFGGKGSHYSALYRIEDVNVPDAFVIPVYFYNQFMVANGFDVRVDALLADPEFESDPAFRDETLATLRADMKVAPVDEAFLETLVTKLDAEFPGIRMRFRSSTNAEDLGDFTGAGLYTSQSGDPHDPEFPLEDAIREVWSSIWFFRAFEERAYRGIDHKKVGMALLVHRSYPDEEANGVASTANPFDTSGAEPAFYVNVQLGGESVVQPRPGITTDQFIYYYEQQGQPIVFIEHSNLLRDGGTVLSTAQTHELGGALDKIHRYFSVAYGPLSGNTGWYAMDVEFKFEGEEGEEPILHVKQARPYPGR